MENKFNFGSFLIGMFVVLVLLIPTVIKLSNAQKEKTLETAAVEAPAPSVEDPFKMINDTINDVFITEYKQYRCIMVLNPTQDDPNEVLIYIQDKYRGTTVPLHTTLSERYNWDSLKVHSAEFTKRSVELMFE